MKKTNIRKQCYGREIKEEKEMIKEDKRRQPQNQALCVHSSESKYKLDSNSKFRKKVGLKLMRNTYSTISNTAKGTQNIRPQQLLRMSQVEHLNYDI